jgi:hypothetical protein
LRWRSIIIEQVVPVRLPIALRLGRSLTVFWPPTSGGIDPARLAVNRVPGSYDTVLQRR